MSGLPWYAVGTRVYAQRGEEPAMTDKVIAACMNPVIAQLITNTHNAQTTGTVTHAAR